MQPSEVDRGRQNRLLANILAAKKARELNTEMLIEKINNFQHAMSIDDRPVCIFGFGLHTLELVRRADAIAVDYFIDSDPKKQGLTFLGKTCVAPDEMNNLGLKTVIISSHRFRDEIQAQLVSLEIRSLKTIFNIYETD